MLYMPVAVAIVYYMEDVFAIISALNFIECDGEGGEKKESCETDKVPYK